MPLSVTSNLTPRSDIIGITGGDWTVVDTIDSRTDAGDAEADNTISAGIPSYYISATDPPGGIYLQYNCFEDLGGLFDGFDLDTPIRWFRIVLGVSFDSYEKGGPSFRITLGNGSIPTTPGISVGVQAGIGTGGEEPGGPLDIVVADWFPLGGSAGWNLDEVTGVDGYNTIFPNINPVTLTYWTIRDLIGFPTGLPLGPPAPQPTMFYVRHNFSDTPTDSICDGWILLSNAETLWFMPTVTVLPDPNFGPVAGGTSVTIVGESIADMPNTHGATFRVLFDGIPATSPNVTHNPGDDTITCNTPAHAAGYVDVTVSCCYPDGTTEDVVLLGAYLYTDDPTPPDEGDIQVTGSGGVLVGSVGTGDTSIVMSKDPSGMYTLVPDQHFDRVYTRNVDPDDTTDVAIPTPFAKTGYFGR